MRIAEAQQRIDEWIKKYGVRYFHQTTIWPFFQRKLEKWHAIIARRYGEQSEKPSDANKDLGDEMADVMWVLMCLANQCDIDLEQAFEKNLEKKTLRDSERHLNNPKLK